MVDQILIGGLKLRCEIGVPADHVTEIDHEMVLPTAHLRPREDGKASHRREVKGQHLHRRQNAQEQRSQGEGSRLDGRRRCGLGCHGRLGFSIHESYLV